MMIRMFTTSSLGRSSLLVTFLIIVVIISVESYFLHNPKQATRSSYSAYNFRSNLKNRRRCRRDHHPLSVSSLRLPFSILYSTTDKHDTSSSSDDLSWLNLPEKNDRDTTSSSQSSSNNYEDNIYIQEIDNDNDDGEVSADVHITSTGVSIADEIDAANKDKFITELVPITSLPGVAQIITVSSSSGYTDYSSDPVRYLIKLSSSSSPIGDMNNDNENESTNNMFVMVDVPPYSDKLANKIRQFMRSSSSGDNVEGKLAAILITSSDSIHYDESPAVYTTRQSDIHNWKNEFSSITSDEKEDEELKFIAYRLDIMRDYRNAITQTLDGYGPWALQLQQNLQEEMPMNDEDVTTKTNSSSSFTFVETGRPLTYEEWDDEEARNYLEKGVIPADDDDKDDDNDDSDAALYTPEAIRQRENNKHILAIYTPGHTFGSMTYIFPRRNLCVSGFTIPIEDTRSDNDIDGISRGSTGAGPILDCRGYITTSKGGLSRQMSSARDVINTYSDRFHVILPARGDPLFLPSSDVQVRKDYLNRIVNDYDKIGKIYEQLGITSSSDDEDEDE